MIEIIYDPYRLEPAQSEDLEIERDSQYEKSLCRIREAFEAGTPLKVWVRNQGMRDWFDGMKAKYGAQLRALDPVRELSRKFDHAPLPSYLKEEPELIVRYSLLDRAADDSPGLKDSPEKWVRKELLGDIWIQESLEDDSDRIALLRFFCNPSNKKIASDSFLSALLDRHLEAWIQSNGPYSDLLRWLRADPFKRAGYLAWERILSAYPSDQVAQWFQQDGVWALLNQFPGREFLVPELPLDFEVHMPSTLISQIRAFLKEQWENFGPEKAIAFISGREYEIRFLRQRLQKRLRQGASIENALYQQLIRASNHDPKVLELAEKLLLVTPPPLLAQNAELAETQRWLAEDYLPYYRHCARLQRPELALDAIASFETWLKANYPTLLVKGDGIAHRQLNKLKSQMGKMSLVLVVVDGLDYLTAKEVLLPRLTQKGLYPQQSSPPYLSFIPTETYIAKPSLLRGKMPSQFPEEKAGLSYYKALVQERFDLKAEAVKAGTDRDMPLENLVNEPATVYLYMDNYLDRDCLHVPLHPDERAEKYAHHMEELADAVIKAVRRIESHFGGSPLVLVCSDHGYTEIPRESPVIGEGQPDSKSRSRKANGPLGEPERVWRLSSEFGLHHQMEIPLGYGCFGSRPRGATHGGATPQEVAVPWMIFGSTEPDQIEQLRISVKGEVHRKRKENPVQVCIYNPNLFPITLVDLSLDKVTFAKTQLPLEIPPEEGGGIKGEIDASQELRDSMDIQGRYQAKSRQGAYNKTFELKVETQGAMSFNNGFEDDFDI